MDSCVALPISPKTLNFVSLNARDWALLHGAGKRSKTQENEDSLEFAPFALLPSSFPTKVFQEAKLIQKTFNFLIHKVAHDYNFLKSTLKSVIQVDDFTANLFKIYETVHKEGISQNLCFGILRSDFFFNTTTSSCKQVEVNTIASSFGALATITSLLHRYVLNELGEYDKSIKLPENNALKGMADGLIQAWKLYGNPEAVVLFLVEDKTYNICDQRFFEFEIREINPQIRVIRKSLTEVGQQGAFTGSDKKLYIDEMEVGVIYMRAGYCPTHYHSDLEWGARLLLERSKAIKCPPIHYHLAGTKKVQQELSRPGVLEKFLSNPTEIKKVRDTFVCLYSLEMDAEGDEAVNLALKDPERYVLKPQREGGGNNLYGEEIRKCLLKVGQTVDRTAYILMERIWPPVQQNYIIRPGCDIDLCQIVSELGIFGYIIGTPTSVLFNEEVGHTLRSKLKSSNEGGVAAGLGALDSPYLVDL